MSIIKIIGTIGPASFSRDILTKMTRKGLSAVRINTAHVEPEYLARVRKLIDSVNTETGRHVGVMVDLKGPELRLLDLKTETISITKGRKYLLSGPSGTGDLKLNRDGIIERLRHGNVVKMNDGRVTFQADDPSGNTVELTALNDGSMRQRARINIPGVYLDLGSITERDLAFVKEGIKQEIEFFAMSFVQTRENVLDLEQTIRENGGSSGVVSKIETMRGYSDIRQIVEVSEMIMVARGDLGVELPLSEIGIAQKRIIVESHKRGRPAILATQILESMVSQPEPTRAEVSDVTNAVYDNADVLMLSEETAIGKYPVEAVGYLRDISNYALRSIGELPEPEEFYGNEVAYSISKAAKIASKTVGAEGIIAFTRSGNTARMLSALRPPVSIYAVVTSERLARRINLLHGVIPVTIPQEYENVRDLNELVDYLRKSESFDAGKRFVVLSGLPYFLFGGTNDLRIVSMGEYIGRGYPRGKSITGSVTTRPESGYDVIVLEGDSFTGKLENYKGIIFTGFPTHKVTLDLKERGISILTGAQFFREVKNGERITWDSKSGIITSAKE